MIQGGNFANSKFRIDVVDRSTLKLANYTNKNVLLAANPEVPYYHRMKRSALQYMHSEMPNIYGAANTTFYDSFYGKKSGVEMVESDIVRHEMLGTGKTYCISKENLMIGEQYIGIAGSEITLKLDEQIFQSSDTLYPEKEPGYRFTVQGKPHNDGTGWIYKLQFHTTNPNSYVPQSVFTPGLTWMKDNATFGEGSNEWGSTYSHGTSLLVFQSSLTSFSKQHKVSDEGHYQGIRIKSYNGNMQIDEKLIGIDEATMVSQFNYEKQHTLFWGRAAGKNVKDISSGNARLIGEGAIEFFEDGNMTAYNRNRPNLIGNIEDKLNKLIYGKIQPNKAQITIQAGLGLIDDGLTAKYSRTPVDKNYGDYIKSGASYNGSNTPGKKLTTPTFLEWDLKPYGSVRVEHLPVLDDVEMHGELILELVCQKLLIGGLLVILDLEKVIT